MVYPRIYQWYDVFDSFHETNHANIILFAQILAIKFHNLPDSAYLSINKMLMSINLN